MIALLFDGMRSSPECGHPISVGFWRRARDNTGPLVVRNASSMFNVVEVDCDGLCEVGMVGECADDNALRIQHEDRSA